MKPISGTTEISALQNISAKLPHRLQWTIKISIFFYSNFSHYPMQLVETQPVDYQHKILIKQKKIKSYEIKETEFWHNLIINLQNYEFDTETKLSITLLKKKVLRFHFQMIFRRIKKLLTKKESLPFWNFLNISFLMIFRKNLITSLTRT